MQQTTIHMARATTAASLLCTGHQYKYLSNVLLMQTDRGAKEEGVFLEGNLLEAVGPGPCPALQHLPRALPSS